MIYIHIYKKKKKLSLIPKYSKENPGQANSMSVFLSVYHPAKGEIPSLREELCPL